MSTSIPEILNPLRHSGTHRFERLSEEMRFDYVQVEERHETRFLQYAEKLANTLQYYNSANQPTGSWQSFFDLSVDAKQPYRALFIAFVRLLEALNEHANGLPERHLNYYYKEVLQFTKDELKPEKAHVFFECAESLKERFIEKGSSLIAGKTQDGENLLFELVDELVVNKGTLTRSLAVFRHDEDNGNRLFSKDYTEDLLGDFTKNTEGISVFGESQTVTEKQSNGNFETVFKDNPTMDVANVGFALSSSLLRMAEGTRTIVLKLAVEKLGLLSWEATDFQFSLTTEEEWFELEAQSFSIMPEEITIKLKLNETDPAVTNFDKETHGGNYRSNLPVIRMKLSPGSDAIKGWKKVVLRNVTMSVSVTGVQSLVLQNEVTNLDPSKPFLPFGALPTIGNRFYVGHPDIFSHPLKEVKTHWNWKGITEDTFDNYYANYEATISNNSFQVTSETLKERKWEQSKQHNIFDPDKAKETVTLIPDVSNLERVSPVSELERWDYSTNYGFLKFTLDSPDDPNFQAFGHGVYPKEVIRNSVLTDGNGNKLVPNQPYLPTLESLTLDYETTEVNFFDTREHFKGTQSDFFYHIEPFGEKEIQLNFHQKTTPLLPQFPFEGELFIGMKGLILPQSVSLLFQFVEGTADQSKSRSKTNITWYYLANNEWKALDRLRISKDTTRNLLHTGILRFDLPEDINAKHTVMPTDTFWLKAGIPEKSAGIDRLQSIHIHAAEIVETDPEKREVSLAPSTIQKFSDGNKGLDVVNQPFGSFGGSSVESQEIYYARVTERLRHKDRGVMIWDYERLILDAFPEIFKVKCLNHTNYQTELAPGHVMLAVIPNLRRKERVAIFQPKLSIHRRMEVYDFLRERISPFIYLRVENPIYEPIQLSFNVGFHKGYDEGFYGKKLHAELQEFLAPWAFEQELNASSDLVFGGELHKSTILKFIEDLSYVDFVNDFNMYHMYQDPSVAESFSDEIAGSDIVYGHASHQTVGAYDACDRIRLAYQVQDENALTSLIEVKVRFLKGIMELDDDQMVERFLEDLNGFLDKKKQKGEPITRTALRIALKTLFYIDQIFEIQLYRELPDGYILEDCDVAIAKTSRSILVTSEQHRIGVYQAGDYNCEGNLLIGIGVMIIEADFIVSPENIIESNEYTAR